MFYFNLFKTTVATTTYLKISYSDKINNNTTKYFLDGYIMGKD